MRRCEDMIVKKWKRTYLHKKIYIFQFEDMIKNFNWFTNNENNIITLNVLYACK